MIITHTLASALIIYFSVDRSTGHSRESKGNSDVLVFLFFPAGKGSCLVLETTSLDHGDVPRGYVRGSGTGEVKSASMVDVWKCKNIGCVCLLFLPMKSTQYILAGLTLKGWRRLLCYSWKLVKDIMLWQFILSHREGLFFTHFMPPTQGLRMVLVCHEKFPVGVPGVDPQGSKR